MAVVVLPTPPFWLTTATTLDGASSAVVEGEFDCAERVDTVMEEAYRAARLLAMEDGCAEARRPVEKPVDALGLRRIQRRFRGQGVEILCALGDTAKGIVPRGTSCRY
jgi:hypothetical protein